MALTVLHDKARCDWEILLSKLVLAKRVYILQHNYMNGSIVYPASVRESKLPDAIIG